MEFLKALLFGILEGITEWLPVSSTGHLILLERFVTLGVGGSAPPELSEAFYEMFGVVIQLGAIAAVAFRCYRRLSPFAGGKTPSERRDTVRLYLRLLVSGLPAALVGVLGDAALERFTGRDVDGWLYNGRTVAVMLILYGFLFLIPERCLPRRRETAFAVEEIGFGTALGIGCFQALSIIPGTSRSGATILGGMMLGLTRSAAAEYSFLLAIPTMMGASLLKTAKFACFVSERGLTVPWEAYAVLFVGMAAAFLVSLLTVGFLMDFVKKHTFAPFGVYRILLGAAVLLWVA